VNKKLAVNKKNLANAIQEAIDAANKSLVDMGSKPYPHGPGLIDARYNSNLAVAAATMVQIGALSRLAGKFGIYPDFNKHERIPAVLEVS